jgi:SSS family solute:Na+ symporter
MASLSGIDVTIMLVYVVFVLGIGWVLKRLMKTSTDFFLSGRSIPAWITGLAFISANLGAQEVIGMGANGAKYGILTSHFYWIGAIPAMVFVGIFMMPYYYGSRARSVPEYLKLRFDEKTRGLNAISFAVMTVFSSGVSMHAMGELCDVLLGWPYSLTISISAVVVLLYVFAGGLTSAIYNEVLQFFLIVFGFIPLVYLGLRDVGWWGGLKERLVATASHHVPPLPASAYTESWAHLGSAAQNPLGVEWFGLVMGLGFVLSFGYWCTDFLVVQRAMAADSMAAARRTPLIAAIPKMFFPFLVILPGMIALVAVPRPATPGPSDLPAVASAAEAAHGIIPPKLDQNGQPVLDENGRVVLNYDRATPMMLIHYFPAGLLGLGLTALLASFMSGMAGNVTALNTVWTYDIYQSYIRRGGSDQHYLWMGRFATVAGIALSMAAAYVAKGFNNIMDLLQLVFAFVNAPLFATFALGMFWRRTTGHGAFWGLLSGTLAAAVHQGLSLPAGAAAGVKGGYIYKLASYPSEMAQNFWTAIFAFSTCLIVSIAISLLTRPRPADDLKGLVYSLTPKPDEGAMAWYARPGTLAVAVLALTVILNFVFF